MPAGIGFPEATKDGSMKKHAIIPVFIPHLACPNQCVFCNQNSITGTVSAPTAEAVTGIIERNLLTLSVRKLKPGLAFYGGSFTALTPDEMKYYLGIAQPYYPEKISSIRISTRPDYITPSILGLLKEYHVDTIELGVQSTDSAVLKKSGRNYTLKTVRDAANNIRDFGFSLGLQMMTGLPGDSQTKSIRTAEDIISMNPSFVRIYPAVVIKNTLMEQMYRKGDYRPQSTAEVIENLSEILPLFIKREIPVIRLGLHVSDEFRQGSFVAGPEITGLRGMVMSRIWMKKFAPLAHHNEAKIVITVPASQINHAIGHLSVNKKYLANFYREVSFVASERLKNFDYVADLC